MNHVQQELSADLVLPSYTDNDWRGALLPANAAKHSVADLGRTVFTVCCAPMPDLSNDYR